MDEPWDLVTGSLPASRPSTGKPTQYTARLTLYIPTVFNMSRYHNVIHIPVFPSQISKHSSLSGALALPPPEFNSPHRHRVPQKVCKTSEPPVCDPIRFDYTGQAGQGVSLADFSSRSQSVVTQLVAGTNDQVLAGTGIEEIHLRITVCPNVML